MIAKTRTIGDALDITTELPTIRYVKPKRIYLGFTNQRFDKADIYVKPGDSVKIGTILGKRYTNTLEQNIHSTVSGTVVGFTKKFSRTGKLVDAIEIENNFLDEREDYIKERSDEEIEKFTKDDFTRIVKENSVVGLGGSSFPTYVKFQTNKPIDYITINGIECEPSLTTDHRIMLEYPDLIMKGIKYCLQAFKAKKAYICIKKKYDDLYNVLSQTLKRFSDLPIEIKRLGNYYPQGWEVEMIKKALGIKIEHGRLPVDYGVVNFNVSTVVGIYRAVKFNTPVIERNFTVTGNGIKYPSNLRIRIGTSVQDLIEKCGGYTDDSDKILIMGGPMMGANLLKDDAMCTKSSTSLIVINKKDYKEEPCIHCASCVYSCPAGLQPVLIMNAYKTKDVDGLKKLRVNECVECGMCTYTCTSKIHLTDYMRKAKKMVK